MIKEIYPSPGRRMKLDIFESPTKLSLILRYELKEGQLVNRMSPEVRNVALLDPCTRKI